jgi:hypothetical protein
MTNLTVLANLAEIFGTLTILGGGIFAIIQIREFRAQRRQAVSVELLRSFQGPDFGRAMNLIRELPDRVSAEEMRARGPEYEPAAILISTTFETVGLIAYREMASFDMVSELMGGIALVMWRKLETWQGTVRQENAQPSWGEWYQWLAEQLERQSAEKEARPAYERFRSWRPRT